MVPFLGIAIIALLVIAAGRSRSGQAFGGGASGLRYEINPSLRVVDVTNAASLRAMGADGATFLADYTITQRWAQALMRHAAGIEGILYRSRLDNDQRCLAAFGRAELVLGEKRVRPRKSAALGQE
jgi:hypothetical protein